MAKLLKDKNALLGLAAAGAQFYLFCDVDFGPHLLGHWTQDRGNFTLLEAVAALASLQAAIHGIPDYGSLAEGYQGDLIIFERATVGLGMKT